MVFSFFESLFCGSVKRRLENCLEVKNKLIEEYNKVLNENASLIVVNNELKVALESWIKEANLYKAQLEALKDVAIIIPDISSYLVDPIEYDVYDVIDTRRYQYVLAADLEYNTFNYQQWLNVLTDIYPIIKDRWETDIYDCDNFAEMMHAYVSLAFKNADQTKQGMLGIAWSRNHAYLTFMTKELKWFVYEPQTDEVVGELEDEDLEDRYQTRLLLFIH